METANRYLEIRLHEQLSGGFRIIESPTHLLLNMQVDQPWGQVLEALNTRISPVEKFRIQVLFESFVADRKLEFRGEYVAIYEWPPSPAD